MSRTFPVLFTLAFVIACTRAPAAPEPRAAGASAAAPARAAPRTGESAGRAARRTPIVETVERVAPAVVNISTEQRVQNPFRADPFWNFFGDPFFGGNGGGNGGEGEEQMVQNSLGSGVIVDPAGYILTNNHVISGASRIQVTTVDRKTYTAEVVGADGATDLALLKIENGRGTFPTVKIGSSSDLMIGETVLAIGNPYGLSHTVSSGILSAIGRTLPSENGRGGFSDFLQTDAPINPGNSGGPLVNILGELIGVNTAVLAKGQSIGFAIPIDRAKKIMGELRTGGVRALWLGMQVNEQDARQRVRSGRDGLLISRVFSSAAADAAGLKAGDLLYKLNGREMRSLADYDTALAALSPGENAAIEYLRRAAAVKGAIRIAAAPKAVDEGLLFDLLGLKVGDGDGAAVIRAVGRDTAAAETGLAAGDRILKINGQPTPDAAALKRVLAGALGQDAVSLVIQRGRGYYRISLPMGS